MTPANQSEKQPFELIEEAFHLVRLAPTSALAAYYLGSLPFLLALLYFWSDMSRSAFADQRLIPGVLLLTGLFVWMKAWQSVYCRFLLALLCGEPAPRLGLRSFLQTAVFQAIVQPAGLFLLPIGLILMIPFGWLYGFFSSATVVHGGTSPNLRTALARSGRLMVVWPLQNHYLITLFFLFGIFVFLNLFTALLGVPFLLKILLGIETVFTRSPWAAMNGTLLAAQIALTYLCLDPVVKAGYVLRCFYGESLATAQDLRAELRSLRPAAATLLIALFLVPGAGSTPVHAAEPPDAPAPPSTLSPARLNDSIERTIQKREYSWRLPPVTGQELDARDDNSFMARLGRQLEKGFKAMGRWIEDFFKWLGSKLRGTQTSAAASGFQLGSVMGVAMILLIALLLGIIVWVLFRLWTNRTSSPSVVAEALPAAPDLADENVSADELPEEGWLRLAREMMARGELRLALRAFYLASLSHLEDRNLITLARFKSNRDYERELKRRGHALAGLPRLFSDNVSVFERVWYGEHAVTPEMLDAFSLNLQRMKGGA